MGKWQSVGACQAPGEQKCSVFQNGFDDGAGGGGGDDDKNAT